MVAGAPGTGLESSLSKCFYIFIGNVLLVFLGWGGSLGAVGGWAAFFSLDRTRAKPLLWGVRHEGTLVSLSPLWEVSSSDVLTVLSVPGAAPGPTRAAPQW